MQAVPLKVDRVFRALREITGVSLLGGVLAGAIGGSGATVAIAGLVFGGEEFGLIVGAAVGAIIAAATSGVLKQ